MKKIIFVCAGNTCRSPMAQALMRQKLSALGVACDVQSRGISLYEGEPANPNAVAAVAERGLSLDGHRSKAVTGEDLADCDIFICMTPSIRAALLPYARCPVIALQIADPYGGDMDVYRACLSQIDAALDRLLFLPPLLVVRPCAPEDAPALAAIEKETFADAWREALVSEELNNELSCGVTAALLDTPVGYIFAQNVSGEVFISRVAVRPDLRRRGIGAAMLRAGDEACAENGAATLTLEVRVSNRAAIDLYEKTGLKIVGERPSFYEHPTENAYIMTKEYHSEDSGH